VFVNQIFWFDGEVYSTDTAYVLFLCSFTTEFDEVVLLGRLSPERGRRSYVLNHKSVRFVPLPYYPSNRSIWKVGPHFYYRVRQAIRSHANDWDLLWVEGPHPLAHCVARQWASMRKPLILIARMDIVRWMASIHRGPKWILATGLAWLLDRRFRQLATYRTVFAVGTALTELYRGRKTQSYTFYPSLVSEKERLSLLERPRPADSARLICVGRLAKEKGINDLLTALTDLKDLNCVLDLVGSGPEEDDLKGQVTRLGLEQRVTFHGYIDFGPTLFDFYQRSTVLVVPSLSEGFPQVIIEALACGLPIIASDVGGISGFLKDRHTALLIPAGNPGAIAIAIREIFARPELRRKLVENGQKSMLDLTLEAQRTRIMDIMKKDSLVPMRACS